MEKGKYSRVTTESRSDDLLAITYDLLVLRPCDGELNDLSEREKKKRKQKKKGMARVIVRLISLRP